VIISWYQ